MIDKQYFVYVPICDICGQEAPETFETWQDAVDYKARNWLVKKISGEWIDLCPKCWKGAGGRYG